MNVHAEDVVTLMVVIATAFAGCTSERNDGASQSAEQPRGPLQVVTLNAGSVREIGLSLAVAEIKSISGTVTVAATLLPNQDFEANVGSLVQGRVREVFVNAGDVVTAGQELMEIEGLEVGEITSRFITAKAHMKYARTNYERQKTLLEQNVGSRKAFLEAQAECDKALAGFDAEDKRIHSIGLTDDDVSQFVERSSSEIGGHSGGVLPIKTPIAGIVVERNVVIGQHVDASTTAFRIVNTSTLWADGQLYEKDLPQLKGKPEVRLTVTAFPGEEFRGRVTYLSPVVDEKTRTVTIRASVPNRQGRLKPHMFGQLHIPTGGTTRGLMIPAASVQKDNGDMYVFVATSDSTFERRGVTLGEASDSDVEVLRGIAPGETIVNQGAFQLKSELMKEALTGGE